MLVENREATTSFRPQTFSPIEQRLNFVPEKETLKETAERTLWTATAIYAFANSFTSDDFASSMIYFGIGMYSLYKLHQMKTRRILNPH